MTRLIYKYLRSKVRQKILYFIAQHIIVNLVDSYKPVQGTDKPVQLICNYIFHTGKEEACQWQGYFVNALDLNRQNTLYVITTVYRPRQ